MFWSRRQGVDELKCEVYMNKKSIITLSVLKQLAKNLQKEKSLSWHKALDEAARESGYTNYKNYQNQTKLEIGDFVRKILLENDPLKKEELAILFLKNFQGSFQDRFKIIEYVSGSNEVIKLICEKSNLIKEIELLFLKDLQADKGGEVEIYAPNFIANKVLFSELNYELQEGKICIEGNYELKLKFDGEVPNELKNLPHFNSQPMYGDFEIMVDKNKKIIIDNQSIGWKE